jgi:hypothetical protein
LLQAYTRGDIRAKRFLNWARSDDDRWRDVTEQLTTTFKTSDANAATTFLKENITRALNDKLEGITCNDVMPMECRYNEDVEVPTDIMRTISKVRMMYFNDFADEREELDHRVESGLFEQRDYYEAQNVYRENMKNSSAASAYRMTLPAILNMIYRYNQSTYVDADGETLSLFDFGEEIGSTVGRDDWESDVMVGLLYQRRGEACRSKSDLNTSIREFDNAINGGHLAKVQQTFARLWLARSEAILYALSDDKDKETLERKHLQLMANLDPAEIDRLELDNGGLLKEQFESELAVLKRIERQKMPMASSVQTDLHIADSKLCPLTTSRNE